MTSLSNGATPSLSVSLNHPKLTGFADDSAALVKKEEEGESEITRIEAPESSNEVSSNSSDSAVKNHIGTFIYDPNVLLPCFQDRIFHTFDVKIENSYLHRSNVKVQSRFIWGDRTYTDDSDPVAIVYHSELQRDPILTDLIITLEVMPKQPFYPSSRRNNLLSREWKDHDGVSLRLIHVAPIPLGKVLWNSRKTRKQRLDLYSCLKQEMSGLQKLPALIFDSEGQPSFKYHSKHLSKSPNISGTFTFFPGTHEDKNTLTLKVEKLKGGVGSKFLFQLYHGATLLKESKEWSDFKFTQRGIRVGSTSSGQEYEIKSFSFNRF